MTPAPVMIPAYRRLGHLKQTIDALSRNRLAEDTELYITSDGPRPGDEEQVEKVRDYLKGVRGFRKVEVLAREKNDRLGNWRARRDLASSFGRLIFVEDDCVTSPEFLSYMNANLERYEDDLRVFSISGYVPPLQGIKTDPMRLFRTHRFKAWGFGIYGRSDAMVRCQPDPGEYHQLLRSKELISRISRRTGLNFIGMLKRCVVGEILAYDVMATLEVVKRDLDVIIPTNSLVRNIGVDGSGLHCGTSTRFDTLLKDHTNTGWSALPEDSDPDLPSRFARFYGSDPAGRLKFHSKRLRGRLNVPEGIDYPKRHL